MKKIESSQLSIPDIINNIAETYEGNLRAYFKTVFEKAKNLSNPYHNFRHLFHTVWTCHDAIMYYLPKEVITKTEARCLLIAAMFHDFDHTGRMGHDDLEIERALRGLGYNIENEDKIHLSRISRLIRVTEFGPKGHVYAPQEVDLLGLILRDADLSQVFSPTWIQQIVFGLSAEMGATPAKVFEMQEAFLKKLNFSTDWAKQRFNEEKINAKIQENKDILDILNFGN